MQHIFVFEFVFDDDTIQRHELPIEGYTDDEYLDRLYEELNERNLEERYGVHDWSTTNSPDFDFVEDIGFTTYEVEKSKVSNLLKEWEEILIIVGIKIGTWKVQMGSL